nr:MAG TPA: ExsB [Caudoviricetes sp.]
MVTFFKNPLKLPSTLNGGYIKNIKRHCTNCEKCK